MITTISLRGKSSYNKLNLKGKQLLNTYSIPLEVKKIKILILNNLILPLISKQWATLYENLFCIEKAKRKIDYYYETYKLDDLIIYKEIIKAFELIICEHQQLEDLEKKIYSGNKDFSTMIYKTTLVRLKPEYEIYDIILGKPDKNLNEKYNDIIIKDIEYLLSIDNINFNKIKEIIQNKYCELNKIK
jgi:hypothetical protein